LEVDFCRHTNIFFPGNDAFQARRAPIVSPSFNSGLSGAEGA
jgi:hypothetical protein